jgi:hypothetical protein
LFSQKQPLASKLLVLVLDWTAVPLRKFFAFRRVGAELFRIAVACDTPHLIGLCISVVNVVQKGSQTVPGNGRLLAVGFTRS